MINSIDSLERLFKFSTLSLENRAKVSFLYEKLHFKTWAYRQLLKKRQLLYNSAIIASLSTVTCSTIIGIFYPVALACNAISLLIQGITKQKRLEEKIANLKFAYSSYEKILNDILKIADTDDPNISLFIEKIDWLDDQSIDMCPPLPTKYNKIYKNKYSLNLSKDN